MPRELPFVGEWDIGRCESSGLSTEAQINAPALTGRSDSAWLDERERPASGIDGRRGVPEQRSIDRWGRQTSSGPAGRSDATAFPPRYCLVVFIYRA